MCFKERLVSLFTADFGFNFLCLEICSDVSVRCCACSWDVPGEKVANAALSLSQFRSRATALLQDGATESIVGGTPLTLEVI